MPKHKLTDEEIIDAFAEFLKSLISDEDVDDDEEGDEEDDEEEDDEEEEDEDEEADEEEDEEEDESDEDEEPWDEDSLGELDRDDLKSLAEQFEIDFTPKTATKTLISAILDAQAEDEGEDEDEEEEEDEESDEDGEFWTAEELADKPIGELRAICKDYDIPTKGKDAAALRKLILNA